MNQLYLPSRPVAKAPRFDGKKTKPSPLILGFLIVLCLPSTIATYMGDVLITPYRVYMLALLPYLLFRLVTDKAVRAGPADFLLISYSLWSAYCMVSNIEGGYQRAGQMILESVSAYILARVTVRSINDLLYIVKWLFILSFVAFVLAVPEAITHKKFIMDITSSLTGMQYAQYAPGADVRMGLRRPQAFFSNTILYGLFCASCISLVWYTTGATASRIYKAVVLAMAAAISLSSAPLLAMNVQFTMIAGEFLTRGVKNRVSFTLILSIVMTLIMNVTTNSGVIGFIVNHLTFNQASAFNRVLIWNWGLYNIKANPIFGLDADNWVRAEYMKASCDNYWIVITMLGGIPALLFLLAGIFVTFRNWGKLDLRGLPPIYNKFRTGWFFCYIAFAFTGFSVMFFGGLQPLFFFFLGLAGAGIPIYKVALQQARKTPAVRRPERGVPLPANTQSSVHVF